MDALWQVINQRQLAILIWGAVIVLAVLAFFLTNGERRSDLWSLITGALTPKLSVTVSFILIWNGLAIWLLHHVGYWHISMLTDTLALVVFGSISTLGRAIDATFSLGFFLKTIVVTLGLTVAVQLVVNMYPFPLWAELVFVVPAAASIATMTAFIETKPEYKPVYKVFRFLEISLGLALLIRAVLIACLDYRSFLSLETLKEALLPLVVTALFLPLLLLLCVWIAYESAFIPLRIGSSRTRRFTRHAKWSLARAFGLNIFRLQQFDQGVTRRRLQSATSTEEVDEILRNWHSFPAGSPGGSKSRRKGS